MSANPTPSAAPAEFCPAVVQDAWHYAVAARPDWGGAATQSAFAGTDGPRLVPRWTVEVGLRFARRAREKLTQLGLTAPALPRTRDGLDAWGRRSSPPWRSPARPSASTPAPAAATKTRRWRTGRTYGPSTTATGS